MITALTIRTSAFRFLFRVMPFLIMALLTLLTFWLVKKSAPPETSLLQRVPKHEPDYILNNGVLSNLNELGQTKYRLLGKKLIHYEDDASIDITKPRMRSFNEGKAPVTVTANMGHLDGDVSILDLNGNGEIFRPAQEANAEKKASPQMIARSDYFQVLINDDVIKTHLPIQLEQGFSVLNSSEGGTFNNVQQSMVLNGRVKGRIERSEQGAR
ncbi:MAG: LPS export ABC transporter periplasmic protein LptC [Polynucleobacter sp.]|jgi:lipopolysaccharide export system protein LptC|nr:LPS export ABC transporter periplasmic protein LptC [Polynucleobacter sp.]